MCAKFAAFPLSAPKELMCVCLVMLWSLHDFPRVWEGCPLSAVLYSLTAESLAEMLKMDKEMEGIKLPNEGESKI